MALLEFFSTNPDLVLTQTIQQVISNAGDGQLRDSSEASSEFRRFLTLVPIESVFSFSRQCPDASFPKSGSVLEDLVNELGRRLDFEVENGL